LSIAQRARLESERVRLVEAWGLESLPEPPVQSKRAV
jgi:hypothetical protein